MMLPLPQPLCNMLMSRKSADEPMLLPYSPASMRMSLADSHTCLNHLLISTNQLAHRIPGSPIWFSFVSSLLSIPNVKSPPSPTR